MIDIQHIKDILDSKQKLSNEFGKYSKIYMMTTENIRGFLDTNSLQDSEVLTVAGSGDQLLNAYLMGAKNVTCFDINPLAFQQVKLKKAAATVLSYQEFLNFFFPEFHQFLSYEIFERLLPFLDSETKAFFQYLYETYEPDDIFKRIYYPFFPTLDKMRRMNAYLDEEQYTKLSSILEKKEVSFIESDITTLKEKLDSFYDIIMLSNISDSIQSIWLEHSLKKFKSLVHSLSKNLNCNGIIQVGYIYDYYFRQFPCSIFRNKSLRESVFTTDEFHTTFVESYRFHSESDAIITYQKLKKK